MVARGGGEGETATLDAAPDLAGQVGVLAMVLPCLPCGFVPRRSSA